MFYYVSRIIFVLILALITAVLHQGVINTRIETPNKPPAHTNNNLTIATVVRVIDGDTIELKSGKHVRYIGIDTPEMNFNNNGAPECFAKKATDRNSELTLGKNVFLITDVNNTDKYGRLLRYVYLCANTSCTTYSANTFVNTKLVREGYAAARSYPPDISKQDELRKAEKYARENKNGLWADGACRD